MIKILKEGIVPKPKRIIYKTTCENCHCEFEFEPDDCLFIERRLNGNVVVDCPCCNKHVNCKHESLSFREVEEKIANKIKDLTLEEFKNNYCNKNNNNCEKCKFYSDDDGGCMSVPGVVLVYGDQEVEENSNV